MLKNPSFENGWTDIETGEEFGWLINQKPTDWHLRWLDIGESLFGNDEARGVPECVHKLTSQLPPNEQPGGSDPLILDGGHVYKVFHNGASFGVELWQIVEGLEPGTIAAVSVPIRIHAHNEKRNPDTYSCESGVWILDDWTVEGDLLAPLNGEGDWVPLTRGRQWKYIGGVKPDGWVWYYHEVEIEVPASGAVCVLVRVKSKWDKRVDFFIDDLQFEAEGGTEPPPIEPPPTNECGQTPDDKRVFHLFPQDLSMTELSHAINEVHTNKNTVGFSHDDAISIEVAGDGRSLIYIWEPERRNPADLDAIGECGCTWEPRYFDTTPEIPPVIPPPTGGEMYTTKDFMQPDPRSFVVVDRAEHGGENVSTVITGSREDRVKNGSQKEVYEWRNGAPFRILDTSPADDPTHGPCLYLQYADPAMTQPGGQIAPAVCEKGVTYEYWSQVQFKSKDGCQPLDYRSGWARSTFCLDAVTDNYTFDNGVTVDRLYETTQTGEKQLYTLKDGIMRGWSGGGANQHDNEWGAMPIEFYLDRTIQPVTDGYCD